MKKRAILAALVLATGIFHSHSAVAGLAIQQWRLPSGAQVLLAESHAIPMVDVQIDFDAGSRRDPAAQAGLAAVTAGMTDKGIRATGAEPALDENSLGEAWADLGASFSGSASGDRLGFSLRSLSDPALLARAAQLAARQMGEPAFPEAVWQRERERMVAALKEADTRPATLAGRAFNQAVYGNHPYGQQTTALTLAAIAVDNLRAFHARHLVACRAQVSMVGALTRAQAEVLASSLLARLGSGACAPLPPVADVAPLAGPVERAIPFESAQAHVYIGQPGVARSDPDYFTLFVGNYVLGGGGFVSRLTTEVREKRGLSYSVSSYFMPGLHAGAFILGLQTRPDQAAEAVRVSREVVARFVAEGPTEAELQAAKDNLIGGFALRIDSNRKLLDNIANIGLHQLPLDYLDTWTQQVDKVTVAEVRAAFQRKLQPGAMATVVVGGVLP